MEISVTNAFPKIFEHYQGICSSLKEGYQDCKLGLIDQIGKMKLKLSFLSIYRFFLSRWILEMPPTLGVSQAGAFL